MRSRPGSKAAQHILFLFVDGIGIGTSNPAVNPLAALQSDVLGFFDGNLGPFPRGGVCYPTDPCLGVPGLPQSATGQTTLLTGVNASKRVGRHIPGFPDHQLRELISTDSLFLQLQKGGLSATFANVYAPRFFRERPRWRSTTTIMVESSGARFRGMKELHAKRGLFMDYTNRLLREQGIDVPLQSPEEAAGILLDLLADYDLVLYEYFLTDLIGHRGTFKQAIVVLEELSRLISSLVLSLNLEHTSLILSSDHGNIESALQKQHTSNLVPTLVWGPLQSAFGPARKLELAEITPTLVSFLLSA